MLNDDLIDEKDDEILNLQETKIELEKRAKIMEKEIELLNAAVAQERHKLKEYMQTKLQTDKDMKHLRIELMAEVSKEKHAHEATLRKFVSLEKEFKRFKERKEIEQESFKITIDEKNRTITSLTKELKLHKTLSS
jgi:hypothetical protein